MRLFVAIWPPAEVVEELEKVQLRLKSAIDRQGVRFTGLSKVHLTMRFLGNVEEGRVPQVVDSLAANLQAVSLGGLEVVGIGAFPDVRRPAIVWAGISGDLASLHARILEATDDYAERADDKPLHPHLTLARVSPPSQKVGRALDPLVREFAETTFATWAPTEVVLVQTVPGGAYEQMASFPLEPAR